MNSRLRLFHVVITPTGLYGSECWTLSKQLESILRTAQRKMLRMILGQGRRRVPAQNAEQDSSGEDVHSNASNRISDGEDTPEEH